MINFPIQGTASDGLKIALVLLDRKLEGMDARILHTPHDEIIVEAKEEISEEVAEIVKVCMEKAFEKLVPTVPFEVDLKVKDSWGERIDFEEYVKSLSEETSASSQLNEMHGESNTDQENSCEDCQYYIEVEVDKNLYLDECTLRNEYLPNVHSVTSCQDFLHGEYASPL